MSVLGLPRDAQITISPCSPWSVGAATGTIATAGSAAPSANRAYYIPFRIDLPLLVETLYLLTGTGTANNVDVGIYDSKGTRRISAGSTAHGGTSIKQTFNVTDTLLLPGLYYLAFAADNAAATVWRLATSQSGLFSMLGMAQEASAFPLPATATFAQIAAGTGLLPMVGLTGRTGGGPRAKMPPLVTIHPYSAESIGNALSAMGGKHFNGMASALYPAANEAFYLPFSLDVPALVMQMAVINGSAVSGNIDVAVYDTFGVRRVSAGSTAQAGINATQAFNVTDTLLLPGGYYLAVALDNATGRLNRVAPDDTREMDAMGVREQATAFALPATATPTTPTNLYVPAVWLTTRSVI